MIDIGKNQWVVKHPNGWAVKGEGNSRATAVTKTKAQAETIAKRIATNQKSEVITQKRNGQIGSKDSYGNDPLPPKDKEH